MSQNKPAFWTSKSLQESGSRLQWGLADFVLCKVQVCEGHQGWKGVSCLPSIGTTAVSTSGVKAQMSGRYW